MAVNCPITDDCPDNGLNGTINKEEPSTFNAGEQCYR